MRGFYFPQLPFDVNNGKAIMMLVNFHISSLPSMQFLVPFSFLFHSTELMKNNFSINFIFAICPCEKFVHLCCFFFFYPQQKFIFLLNFFLIFHAPPIRVVALAITFKGYLFQRLSFMKGISFQLCSRSSFCISSKSKLNFFFPCSSFANRIQRI